MFSRASSVPAAACQHQEYSGAHESRLDQQDRGGHGKSRIRALQGQGVLKKEGSVQGAESLRKGKQIPKYRKNCRKEKQFWGAADRKPCDSQGSGKKREKYEQGGKKQEFPFMPAKAEPIAGGGCCEAGQGEDASCCQNGCALC